MLSWCVHLSPSACSQFLCPACHWRTQDWSNAPSWLQRHYSSCRFDSFFEFLNCHCLPYFLTFSWRADAKSASPTLVLGWCQSSALHFGHFSVGGCQSCPATALACLTFPWPALYLTFVVVRCFILLGVTLSRFGLKDDVFLCENRVA